MDSIRKLRIITLIKTNLYYIIRRFLGNNNEELIEKDSEFLKANLLITYNKDIF